VRTTTEEFFERLGQVAHDDRLRNARGTVRFDLADGASSLHWYVSVLHGDVVVSREEAPADGVFRAGRELFDDIVTGDANVMAAVLRGAAAYEGDPQLAVIFRRLFGGAAAPTPLDPS
jgi:putative sterol carrier protein